MSSDRRELPAEETLELDALFTGTYEDLPLEEFFPDLPFDIWTEEFFRANELVNLYTDLQVCDVLGRLGLRPGEPLSPRSGILDRLGATPTRRGCAEWLLVKAAGSNFAKTFWGRRCVDDTGEVRRQILAENRALAVSLDLIDLASRSYPEFLRGDIDGRDILFSQRTLPLWDQYFDNQNPIYGPTNLLAAHAAEDVLRCESPLRGRTLRVLEVGAGCGSASETLLDRIGNHVERYTLTDISPHLLRRARERISALPAAEAIDSTFRLLDLDRPRHTWGVDDGEFDVIYAVNVVHCVRDPVECLRLLRGLLKSGGVLALGECVRPAPEQPVHPEFVFQLLHDPDALPLEGRRWSFIDLPAWRRILSEAGFSRIHCLPDFEAAVSAYGEYSVAAIVGQR